MRVFLASVLALIATSAIAQDVLGNNSPEPLKRADMERLLHNAPDYGYVVYSPTGTPIKAFGPDTPVETSNGKLQIPGSELPPGSQIKIEDAPTYFKALYDVSNQQAAVAKSDLTQKIEEMVASINDGATSVKDKLCANPAHPSAIQVQIAGGFSFGVYGSVTGTVDWDLDKVCPSSTATAQ